MSISTFSVRSEYTGNGALASYTFPFKIASKSHLIVLVTDDVFVTTFRVRGTDVTDLSSVTFDAVAGGGTVVLASNLPNGHFLTILLANDEPLQASEFKNKTDFTLKRFEDALDVVAGAVQRLSYLADRSLKISDSVKDAQTFDPTIPIHNTTVGTENNVDKVFCVGDDNASIKMGPTIVSLAAQAAAAAASEAAAAASEGAAAGSAAAALISENNAAASAAAALISENNAAGSEVNAAASAAAALVSQNAAAVSAAAALVSQNAAAVSAAAALVSENNAETAETNAETAETNAAASEVAAALSETNAAASEVAAALSETNAAASEVAAAASAASFIAPITGSIASPTAVTAAGGVVFSGLSIMNTMFISGSGGAVTITANPKITAGTNVGQRLRLVVPAGANQITFTDGTGVDLDGTLIMAAGSSAEFMWDGSAWFELNRRTV